MKLLKLSLLSIAFITSQATFASDGHMQINKPHQTGKSLFLANGCMQTAMAQVTAAVNIAYGDMLACGPAPECTQHYNNTINTVFAWIENTYEACTGVGHAFSTDHPTDSSLYKAMQSK